MKKILKSFLTLTLVLVIFLPLFLVSGCGQNRYTLDLSVSNSSEGVVYGAGTYAQNESITILAVAKDGYEFDKWSDNITTNPRVIGMTENVSLTANFKTLSQNITLSVNNINYGKVYGAGSYEKGQTVKIIAVANNGYEFVKWSDDNTSAERSSNNWGIVNLTAIFREKIFYRLSSVTVKCDGEIVADDYWLEKLEIRSGRSDNYLYLKLEEPISLKYCCDEDETDMRYKALKTFTMSPLLNYTFTKTDIEFFKVNLFVRAVNRTINNDKLQYSLKDSLSIEDQIKVDFSNMENFTYNLQGVSSAKTEQFNATIQFNFQEYSIH